MAEQRRFVEVNASPRVQIADFTDATRLIGYAARHLPAMQNHFEATVARREFIKACVQIAKEYGSDI